MRWEGLGDQRPLTTTENFTTLAEKLRTLAPKAFHDQRLPKNKRRADISAFAGGGKERRIQTSNAGLAAFCSSEVTSKANSKLLNKAHLRHPIAFIPAWP